MLSSPAHIVVCCDGTWCSDAIGTVSNTKILADSFAGARTFSCHREKLSPLAPEAVPAGEFNKTTQTQVFYFQGIASSGDITSAEYFLDCAVACKVRDRCVEVYEAIVTFYRSGTKIWLFGHSRCVPRLDASPALTLTAHYI